MNLTPEQRTVLEGLRDSCTVTAHERAVLNSILSASRETPFPVLNGNKLNDVPLGHDGAKS